MKNKFFVKKYLSMFLTCSIFFTFLTDTRNYIFQNIYKAYNLGNLGAFGAKLDVAMITVLLLAIGVVVGALLSKLIIKKPDKKITPFLFAMSGLFALAFLFFTPYNLQLAFPNQVLQNLVMIDCIALMVFSALNIAFLTLTINTTAHIIDFGTGESIVIMSAAFVLGMITNIFNLSFPIVVGTQAVALSVINVIHCFTYQYNGKTSQSRKGLKVVGLIMLLLIIAALLSGYFITKSCIAIDW